MRRILTAYTVYFNRRYERHGHLFQGRFKSYVVDKAEYLLAVSRYIHLNPQQSGEADHFENFAGSSLRYYIKGNEPDWLDTREILSWFDGNRSRYARFVREGLKEDARLSIEGQRFIGGRDFAKRMWKRMKSWEDAKSRASQANDLRRQDEIQRAEAILKRVSMYFETTPEKVRNSIYNRGNLGCARTLTVALIRDFLPWTYTQIGDFLNLGSINSVKYQLKRMQEDESLKKILRELQRKG